jgi:hypothetical protein
MRTPELGETVHVYRNLNKQCWSVRVRGIVIAHVQEIALEACTFHVSESARQRVIAKRRREVHAYVKGKVLLATIAEGRKVSYRPFQCGHFFTPEGTPVHTARLVDFKKDGRALTN